MKKNNSIEFYLKNPIIHHDFGILLVKDSRHRFIASNPGFSEFTGLPPDKIIGLSDHDMPWAEHSTIYISHEQDILSGHNYSVIEPLPGIKRVNLITQKNVLYDSNGMPAGTIATAMLLPMHIEFSHLAGRSDVIRVMDYGLDLTKTESLVLYHLLKVRKRRDVAELAGITLASFDFHVRSLKAKFGVSTTDDIISSAISMGLQDIMPFVIKTPPPITHG